MIELKEQSKNILVVTPRFPYPEAGACEQDRADGIRQLQRLGYQVSVVAKYFDWQSAVEIKTAWAKEGVDVMLIPYKKHPHTMGEFLRRLVSPRSWDGAAGEFNDPEIQNAVRSKIFELNPAAVWFDYTYLWPLYHLAKEKHIPILVRSINFEARHFLDEDGRSLSTYLRSLPKFLTEHVTARKADVLFSITPAEEDQYRAVHAKKVQTLPLRSLYKKLGTHAVREHSAPLNIFFTGSTFTVAHNRRALEFVLELAPLLEKQFPGKFKIHIFGSKFPLDLEKSIPANVIKRGFVDDLDSAMQEMDIAIAPSFFGSGMQQKIFEPLARGFPTVTNLRGLAGYAFVPGEDVLVGGTAAEYVDALGTLIDPACRLQLSQNAQRKSGLFFGQDVIDRVLRNCFSNIV